MSARFTRPITRLEHILMMTRLFVAFTAFALVVPALSAQDVTFTKKKLAVGDRRTDKGEMSMNMNIEVSMGGQVLQSMEQTQGEKEEIRITVLAKDGDDISKLEIHCVQKSSSQSGPAGEMSDESPLTGQTVVATKKGEEILITDGEGNEIEDEDVVDAAREEAEGKFSGKENEFSKIIPDGPMKVGQTLTVDPATARNMFAKDEDSPLDEIEMTLTLTGTKQHAGEEVGVFDVVLNMSGEATEGVSLQAKLKGQLLLGTANCWPHDLGLEGDFVVSGAQSQGGQEISFAGKGPMKITRSAKYETVK